MLLDISISILRVFKNQNVRCHAILLKAKTISRKILELLQTATCILNDFSATAFRIVSKEKPLVKLAASLDVSP